jgi:hypothetical protein
MPVERPRTFAVSWALIPISDAPPSLYSAGNGCARENPVQRSVELSQRLAHGSAAAIRPFFDLINYYC